MEEKKSSARLSADLDSALGDLEQRAAAQGAGRPANKSSSGALSLLLSFLALGVAGYAAYQVYLGFNRFDSFEQQLAETNGQIARADQRLEQLSVVQEELDAAQQGMSSAVDARLAGLSREIAARSKASTQDWKMAEVEYLVRLASQRILVERETTGAIALLESADRLIHENEITSAVPVRQAIAGDLARLRAVGEVDAERIFLALGALAKEADSLPTRKLEFTPASAPRESATEMAPTDSGWRSALSATLSDIGARLVSLVDFRTGVKRVEPILPPEEDYYVRQNLRLKLETAQLALLKGEQTAYDDSIADSAAWVGRHFDQDNEAARSILAQLDALSKERIARDIPDINGSLVAVHNYMLSLRGTNPAASNSSAGADR